MLDRWYGVTCDGENCGQHTELLGSAADVRRVARRSGWKRISGEQYRGHVRGRDLCPKCAAKEVPDVTA
jgi:hypothetical protein